MCVYMRICVCVCVFEREKDRQNHMRVNCASVMILLCVRPSVYMYFILMSERLLFNGTLFYSESVSVCMCAFYQFRLVFAHKYIHQQTDTTKSTSSQQFIFWQHFSIYLLLLSLLLLLFLLLSSSSFSSCYCSCCSNVYLNA